MTEPAEPSTGASPADVCVLMATAPAGGGESLARVLVESRLVACVNVLPGVRSVYRWEGQVQVDDEVVILAKTTRALVGEAREKLLAAHPYDLPEILVLPLVDGLPGYLQWVRSEVSGS